MNRFSRLFNFNDLPPSQGLVAAWNLSNVNDSFSTNNLTNNGGATFVAGKINNCVNLDGIDDYLSIADNAALSIGAGNSLVLCGWFNLAAYAAAGNNSTIISKWDTVGDNREYLLRITDAGVLSFFISGLGTAGTIASVNYPTTIQLNTWYFFVAWFDVVALTLNIELNNDGAIASAASAQNVIFNGTSSFRIGNRQEAGSHLFQGKIDAVRLYKGTDKILVAAQRKALYNNGTGKEYAINTTVAAEEVNQELDQILNLINGVTTDTNAIFSGASTDPIVRINQNGTGPIAQFIHDELVKAEILVNGQFKSIVTGIPPIDLPGTGILVSNLNVDLLGGFNSTELLQTTSYLAFCDSVIFPNTPTLNDSNEIFVQGSKLIGLKAKQNGSASSNARTIITLRTPTGALIAFILLEGNSTAVIEKEITEMTLTTESLLVTIEELIGTTKHSDITASIITKDVSTT